MSHTFQIQISNEQPPVVLPVPKPTQCMLKDFQPIKFQKAQPPSSVENLCNSLFYSLSFSTNIHSHVEGLVVEMCTCDDMTLNFDSTIVHRFIVSNRKFTCFYLMLTLMALL